MNTAWFGDFGQFGPVKDKALYANPFSGRGNVWQNTVQDCIILDEPMRQKSEEKALLGVLEDLRNARMSDTSFEILQKRIVSTGEGGVRLNEEPFRDALFITPRHQLRRPVNRERARLFAQETGRTVFVVVAQYRGH